ncbi:MAG: ribonuclease III [Desulfobacteraceae bacterium]|jgi:ribonuclease III
MNILRFQTTIGYEFSNTDLLMEALRHSSYVNEQTDNMLRDNERLEFLGDAVLNLAIGHLLSQSYPEMHEGDLSRIRANLVNETRLSEVARSIELGDYLLLGKGEIQTNGREKNSILANAFEAVLAAIYLDGGFDTALAIVNNHFRQLVDTAQDLNVGMDFKSRLQEAAQGSLKAIPAYEVVQESGPDHDKTFRVRMTVGSINAEGIGKSKKTAEQEAARRGLKQIEADLDP